MSISSPCDRKTSPTKEPLIRLSRYGRSSRASGIGAIWALCAAVLSLGSVGLATAQSGAHQAIINALDISGDGVLQFEEVGPIARMAFEEFDLNANGSFENSELSTFLNWQREQAISRRQRINTSSPPQLNARSGHKAQAISDYLDHMVETLRLDGAVLIVGRDDDVIYERALGRLRPETPVALASASKLFSATVLLAGAERGVVDLKAPLSDYLPEAKNGWERVTLEQLFSLSAGSPLGHAMRYDPREAPAVLIEHLMESGPVAEPNEVFQYTGTGMQIAGFAVSAAADLTWQELVNAWIAEPTGMSQIFYGHPTWRDDRSPMNTPNIGGGLHASAEDYFKLLKLISNAGRIDGREVLSPESVNELFKDRTSNLAIGDDPPTVPDSWSYTLGAWCENRSSEGNCGRISSTGAYGTYPWIDRDNNLYGILVVVDRNAAVMPFSLELRRRVEAVFSASSDYLENAAE